MPTVMRHNSPVRRLGIAFIALGAMACDRVLGIHDLPPIDQGGPAQSDAGGDAVDDVVADAFHDVVAEALDDVVADAVDDVAEADPCHGLDPTGAHRCCDDLTCAALPPTSVCNLDKQHCVCPSRTRGEMHVSPSGSDVVGDTKGNGSPECPFKTITNALFRASLDSVEPITIVVHHLGGPAKYGEGCDGGAPCDAMPIDVPPAFFLGMTIRGDGTPSDVIVTGGSVFVIHGPSTGFASMTIAPTKPAHSPTGRDGGVGLLYMAGASRTPTLPIIHDVVIRGILPTATTAGTEAGIQILGTASPHIGPNVLIERAMHGVSILGSSDVVMEGEPSKAVTISDIGAECILVDSTATPPPTLQLLHTVRVAECSIAHSGLDQRAAISLSTTLAPLPSNRFLDLNVDSSTKSGAYDGIVLGGSAAVLIENSTLAAPGKKLQVLESSSMAMLKSHVEGRGDGITVASTGVAASGFAASFDGAVVTGNDGNGIRCLSGKIRVRNSTFLRNAWTGLALETGCSADLGSASDLGNNVFNNVLQRNGYSGICAMPGVRVDASNAVFACDRAASGCGSGTPTIINVADSIGCGNGDLTEHVGTVVDVSAIRCCHD